MYDIFHEISSKPLPVFGDPSEAKKGFNKNVTPIKNLVEKIGDLSKLLLEQKNNFLYDGSNIINHTFYTELKRKVQTYALISMGPTGTSLMHMITPKKALDLRFKTKSIKKTLSFN